MKIHEVGKRHELHQLVEGLALGKPVRVGEVSFVPLVREGPGPDADLLEEAQAKGQALVEEIGEHGAVNTVVVKNDGGTLLLLIDGEQIIGAKQNRTINASFLVPPKSEARIPVSCVEQGRWAYKSARFSGAERTVVGTVKKEKLKRLSKSLAAGGGYDADQGAVWKDVDAYLHRTRVASATSALADAEETRSAEVEDHLAVLAPVAGQLGFAAVRGSEVIGIDLMGSPVLYRKAWRKLVRGVLLDIYEGAAEAVDPVELVNRMLRAASEAPVVRQQAPGCGETLAADSDEVAFSAITHEGHVYHAAIAPA
jgi:hypothetical protein